MELKEAEPFNANPQKQKNRKNRNTRECFPFTQGGIMTVSFILLCCVEKDKFFMVTKEHMI